MPKLFITTVVLYSVGTHSQICFIVNLLITVQCNYSSIDFSRIVDSIAAIVSKVEHKSDEPILVKTESVSAAIVRGISGDITARFNQEGVSYFPVCCQISKALGTYFRSLSLLINVKAPQILTIANDEIGNFQLTEQTLQSPKTKLKKKK